MAARLGLGLAWACAVAAGLATGPIACVVTQGEKERSVRTDCITCHRPEYEGARHHVDEKPTTCGVCHWEASWGRAPKDHRWPLVGAHDRADCLSCHSGSAKRYKETSTACFGCHEADFAHPPFPDHARFSHVCSECHSTEAWKPTIVEHPKPAPSATPSASAPPPASASAPAPTAPKPRPQPKPQPKPQPTPQPTPKPPPDIGTGASR